MGIIANHPSSHPSIFLAHANPDLDEDLEARDIKQAAKAGLRSPGAFLEFLKLLCLLLEAGPHPLGLEPWTWGCGQLPGLWAS